MSDRPTTEDIYRGDGRGAKKSAGQLVAEIQKDFSTLFRKEIDLAKTEIKDEVTKKVTGAVLFAVVGVFGFFCLIFLLLALRDGLSEFLPEWGADLITVGVLAIIGAIVALVAKKKLATPIKADLTKQTVKEDIAWAKTLGRQ